MSALRLFIGNKNYSSWSFRPWFAMKAMQIAFDEQLVPFDFENGNPRFAEFTPAKKVPTLHDGDLVVWDSLAILEYLADKFPEKSLWPTDASSRAIARSVANEMHSGFTALRNECPMNMRRKPEPLKVSDDVRTDIRRIEDIWSTSLDASGGPFLFGALSNADAMYAPVVSRIATYQLSDSPVVKTYSQAMTKLPAWIEWETAGIAEPWIVDEDEV